MFLNAQCYKLACLFFGVLILGVFGMFFKHFFVSKGLNLNTDMGKCWVGGGILFNNRGY